MKRNPVRHATVRKNAQAKIRRAAAALALALGLAAVPALHSTSTPPDRMTYQGYLVDGSGNPLAPSTPINYPVVFRIYDASENGNLIWSEQQVVTVDKGNFSVVLGEGAPVNSEPHGDISAVFAGNTATERYLGTTVTVSGNPLNLLPRLRLLPSPYAFTATQAGQLVNPSTGSPYVSLAAGVVNVDGLISASGGFAGLTTAQVPAIPASKITSGILDDARLSGNVPLLSGGTLASDVIPFTLNGNRTFSGPVGISGANTLEFGRGLTKQGDAGKIGYGTFTAGALDIVGAGTSGNNRKIKLWNEGGLFTSGFLTVFGNTAPDRPLTIQANGNEWVSFKDSGGTTKWHINGTGGGLNFAQTGVTDGRLFLNNGFVGINTTAPVAPLDVRGYGSVYKVFTYYAGGSRTISGLINGTFDVGNIGQASGTVDYSILADHRMGASEFNAFSDKRIKDVQGVSDGTKDLDTIRQLKVTDYYPIDKIGDGATLKKGFIAQEVEAVIPEAVSRSKRFVPDIYLLPSSFEYDAPSKQLTVSVAKKHQLKAGDRVQIFADERRLELPVASVLSEEKFVLGECERKPEQMFVYGKQVDDFRVLNYDRIFTTGISAIQELYKIVQAKESRISSLEDKVSKVEALESEILALRKQVAANEEARTKWEARFQQLEKLVAAHAPVGGLQTAGTPLLAVENR